MNFAETFIKRPVATTLLVLTILIFGIMGYRLLPVADLPTVDYPVIQVNARPPGANPDTMAARVPPPTPHECGGHRGGPREAVLDDFRHHDDQLAQQPGQHQHLADLRSRPQHRRG